MKPGHDEHGGWTTFCDIRTGSDLALKSAQPTGPRRPADADEPEADGPLSPAEREQARRMGHDPKILDRMGECNSLAAYRAIKAAGGAR